MISLLENAWSPITREIGFLRCDTGKASRTFQEWYSGLVAPRGGTAEMIPVCDTLPGALSRLLPLTSPERLRYLFVSCVGGEWTAFFDNGKTGTDASSKMSQMALRAKCRGVRVVCRPHTARRESGKWRGECGANMLTVFGPEPTDWRNCERAISLANEGQGWEFEAVGQPLPFEKIEQYMVGQVKDRFTAEMLREYLQRLGIEAFDSAFYDATNAVMIDLQGLPATGLKEYTLAELQANG